METETFQTETANELISSETPNSEQDNSLRNNPSTNKTPVFRNWPIEGIKIKPDFNPRILFDKTAIETLASDIRDNGQLQPIGINRTSSEEIDFDSEETAEIIYGQRRYEACKLLGVETVQALVYTNLTAAQCTELALAENLNREDLNPIEIANGFAGLQQMGYTQESIAARFGYDQSTVSNYVRLLQLPDLVCSHLVHKRLNFSQGKQLLTIINLPEETLNEIANEAVTNELNTAEFNQLIRLKTHKHNRPEPEAKQRKQAESDPEKQANNEPGADDKQNLEQNEQLPNLNLNEPSTTPEQETSPVAVFISGENATWLDENGLDVDGAIIMLVQIRRRYNENSGGYVPLNEIFKSLDEIEEEETD